MSHRLPGYLPRSVIAAFQVVRPRAECVTEELGQRKEHVCALMHSVPVCGIPEKPIVCICSDNPDGLFCSYPKGECSYIYNKRVQFSGLRLRATPPTDFRHWSAFAGGSTLMAPLVASSRVPG